jgi:hypothetical protein
MISAWAQFRFTVFASQLCGRHLSATTGRSLKTELVIAIMSSPMVATHSQQVQNLGCLREIYEKVALNLWFLPEIIS